MSVIEIATLDLDIPSKLLELTSMALRCMITWQLSSISQ